MEGPAAASPPHTPPRETSSQPSTSNNANNNDAPSQQQHTQQQPDIFLPDLLRSYTPPPRPTAHDLHYLYLQQAPVCIPASPESVGEARFRRARPWRRLVQEPHGMGHWLPEGEHPAGMPPQVLLPCPETLHPDNILHYGDDEYSALLASEEWSRADTDRLVELWNRLGGRFVVIADRFNYGKDIAAYKTMEDIKERVVELFNRLSQHRQLPRHIVYDKDLDRNRRLQLEALQTRTAEQLKEEVLLTDIMRDMLPLLPEQIHLRERLVQMLVTPENGSQTLPEMLGRSVFAGTVDEKPAKPKKKRPKKPTVAAPAASAEAPSMPASSSVVASGRQSRQGKPESSRPAPPASAAPKPPGPRTVLRSATLKPISRPAYGRHVDRILAEHSIASKPAYPTAQTNAVFEELRELIVKWLELRKARGLSVADASSLSSSLAASGRASKATSSNASIGSESYSVKQPAAAAEAPAERPADKERPAEPAATSASKRSSSRRNPTSAPPEEQQETQPKRPRRH